MKKYFIPLFCVLLGCGEHSFEEWLGGLLDSSSSNEDSSSSRFGGSSSSVGNSGGNNANVVYGADVYYQGETYKTVVIGTQTWLARNLNYNASGSKCYGEGGKVLLPNWDYITLTSAEIQANCSKYGRLYDWMTAMKLPSSCVGSCSSQIGTKHQGICPNGWHIPKDVEWTILVHKVGSNYTAGKYLKTTSGWDDSWILGINGQDSYGFAALPGGRGWGSEYEAGGASSYWWSATENWGASSEIWHNSANMWVIEGDSEGIFAFDESEAAMASIRCLKD